MAILKPKEAYIAIGVMAMVEQMIADLKAASQDDDPGIQFDEICTALVRGLRAFFTGTIMTWEDAPKPPAAEEPGMNDAPSVLAKIAMLEAIGVKFPDSIKDKLAKASSVWATLPRKEQIAIIDAAFDSVEGLFIGKPAIAQALKAARFALGVPDDDPSIGT